MNDWFCVEAKDGARRRVMRWRGRRFVHYGTSEEVKSTRMARVVTEVLRSMDWSPVDQVAHDLVAFGTGAMWIGRDGQLHRIDPATLLPVIAR